MQKGGRQGCHLGYDGKAIDSHSTGRVSRTTGATSDPDADWGKHATSGVDASGKPWKKIKSWFGYGVHLIADTQYEIPAAPAKNATAQTARPGRSSSMERTSAIMMEDAPLPRDA